MARHQPPASLWCRNRVQTAPPGILDMQSAHACPSPRSTASAAAPAASFRPPAPAAGGAVADLADLSSERRQTWPVREAVDQTFGSFGSLSLPAPRCEIPHPRLELLAMQCLSGLNGTQSLRQSQGHVFWDLRASKNACSEVDIACC